MAEGSSMGASTSSDGHTGRLWLVIVTACVGTFAVAYNTTAVMTALPAIKVDLDLDIDTLQWVVNIYMLFCAATLAAMGHFGDTIGMTRMFLTGVILFSFGSISVALTDGVALLLAGRALQGLGVAAIMSTSVALISRSAPTEKRATALGIWAAALAVGFALGPLVGGALTDGVSWRAIFVLDLVILATAMLLCLWVIRAGAAPAVLGREKAPDFVASFALIAGALSVGIGFGLQAIVSNFVSGLILLFEGTLRVGDFIELDGGNAGGGFRGVVKEINTRATVITTNDSVDLVVPNSVLVTTQLTNWTLRESYGRLRVPFGVAYGTDKELVKSVAIEAIGKVESALTHMPGREPQIRLSNFGDSSLDFTALFWVSRQGVRRPGRTRAEFLWELETLLHDNGIEIPFPQRDIHVKSDFRAQQDQGTEPDLSES